MFGFSGLRSTKHTLLLQEMLVFPPVREAGPSHPQVFHQPQVLDLMPYEDVVELACGNTEGRVTGKDTPRGSISTTRAQRRGCKLMNL